jgi:integrase
MSDMPKHPRLLLRGSTYYHRASIPVDIAATYPKTEETFSLRTKDPREALVRVRRAAAEVDDRFAAHRQQLALDAGPYAPELTKAQIVEIEELYFAHLLQEDEETRLEGFFEEGEPKPQAPVPSFDEYVEDSDDFGADARHALARGKSSSVYRSEVEEVLSWDGLQIRLAEQSPSWKPAERALQSAIVRAQDAIASRNRGDVVATPEATASTNQVSEGLLASTVRRKWITERSKSRWVPKTKHEHEVWSQRFLDLVGDKPVGAYTKADGRAFKEALQQLPPNWSKHKDLRDLDMGRAATRAEELQLEPMSDKNVNKLMNFVSAMWMWAAKQYDEVQNSPFSGLKIETSHRAREERDPFTPNELTRIFGAPIYTGCLSATNWKKPGPHVLSDSGKYWVPLISLFSGARLGEIVQLRTADLKEEQGVLYFSLDDEEEDQRLKNANSRRRIPVHPELTRLGFAKLLRRRREAGSQRLFPDLEMGKDGYYSSPFSKYFGRFLGSIGAKAKKNAFHSFRHSFEDACLDAGLPVELTNALQGHGEDGMAARYGKGHSLRKLEEGMRRVRYDGLDLSHLVGGSVTSSGIPKT